MGRGTWSWIVPDGLWEIAEPLIPPSRVRPQGGGTQDTLEETLFTAIIYVLVSGCAWRALPPCFGISKSTAHRRFLIWSRAGVWGRLHEGILHRLDDAGLLDLSRPVLDSAHVEVHLIADRNGLPLSLGLSGANMHDSLGLEPHVRGIPPIRSRRGPRRRRPGKLHADKGYDYDHLRRWLRKRGIRHPIARRGIESSQRLGRHRWIVERAVSWLAGCRRLHRRYERKAEHFLGFVGIATALICHRRLSKAAAPQ
ncbi:IS5 family transposase [Streptomyces sp. NPDC046161]|uniref:IS5 family transposase n=1 Tax=Streptomyces sp. NPDC046161 TaxID=3155132 RepID=UPI0034071EB6